MMRQKVQQSKGVDQQVKVKAIEAKYKLMEQKLKSISNENDVMWNEINDLHQKLPQEKYNEGLKFLDRS